MPQGDGALGKRSSSGFQLLRALITPRKSVLHPECVICSSPLPGAGMLPGHLKAQLSEGRQGRKEKKKPTTFATSTFHGSSLDKAPSSEEDCAGWSTGREG